MIRISRPIDENLDSKIEKIDVTYIFLHCKKLEATTADQTETKCRVYYQKSTLLTLTYYSLL